MTSPASISFREVASFNTVSAPVEKSSGSEAESAIRTEAMVRGPMSCPMGEQLTGGSMPPFEADGTR
jgi:hypothetical protein